MTYTVLTPYFLPPDSPKSVNVGDGFILDSATRLLGRKPEAILSSRAPLLPADLERINSTRFLLVAGSNSLHDHFELIPRFTPKTLDQIKVPIILFGLGHYGIASSCRGLDPSAVRFFSAILERFPHISVRCQASHDYLTSSGLPAERILMTSCPVIYPVDEIDKGFERQPFYRRLVVTLTERFNLADQLSLLPLARELFPADQAFYSLHQAHPNASWLHNFARDLGYHVFHSSDYTDYLDLYKRTDIHIGNRVHAHLKCLSLGIPSFLTPFDLRQRFFSESLDFPLISRFPAPDIATYDFSRFVKRRESARQTLELFLSRIPS